ncbi:MAG: hypothetical protein ACYTG0_18775 [Planctomycetota bacterium]|jgi:hypothetical protein
MIVSIGVLPDSVVVTELTEEDGRLRASEFMTEVRPGRRLGRVSYERLRALGEGVHELALDDDARLQDQLDDHGSLSWAGWLMFSLVTAGVACAAYWFFGNWEANGGRIKIHWLVGTVYALGGKWAAAALLGAPAVVMLGISLKTLVLSKISVATKRKRIQSVLGELAEDQTSRVTLVGHPRDRAVWIARHAGRFQLCLPLELLTEAEGRRAARWLGPPNQPPPDDSGIRQSAMFVTHLDGDPRKAADRALDAFFQVYRLHPCFELRTEGREVFADEEPGDDGEPLAAGAASTLPG